MTGRSILEGSADDANRQWVESPPPFRLCGMCNRFPWNWHDSGWCCPARREPVKASSEACPKWIEREEWKPEPLMLSWRHEKKQQQELVQEKAANLAAQAKRRVRSREGEVYFVRCGEFVKIGFSRFVDSRLSSLVTGSPYEIVVIGTIPGTVETEREMHRRFGRWHHVREWFRPDAEMEAEIADILSAQERT